MILTKLILENFGVYAGKHEIELTPPSNEKPIILFGGLNGRGKTTLLDSLQLVLYGKKADLSKSSKSYYKLLKNYIHRGEIEFYSAAITLEFVQNIEGEKHQFSVKRAWSIEDLNVNETVQVLKDGEYSSHLSKNWQETVEEFLPNRIANLFFFDGERIEQLADREKAIPILKTGVQSLLGVDIIEKLKTDLKELDRRKIRNLEQFNDQSELDQVSNELELLDESLGRKYEDKTTTQTNLDQIQLKLAKINERFQEAGGELYEKQELMRASLNSIEAKFDMHLQALIQEASSDLPLAILTGELESIQKDLEQCEQSSQASILLNYCLNRDQEVIEICKENKANENLIQDILSYFEAQSINLQTLAARPMHYKELLNCQAYIKDLLSSGLKLSIDQAVKGVKELVSDRQEKSFFEDQLAKIPSEGILRPILEEKLALEADLLGINTRLKSLHYEFQELLNRKTDLEAKEKQLKLKFFNNDNETDTDRRVLKYSNRINSLLSEFQTSIVESNLQLLENTICEAFTSLIGKQNLVSTVNIDPVSYHITLRDSKNQLIDFEAISSGERQLMATAILWGLKRCANREVPAVIDTPLGRLDSIHRSVLSRQYFPYASHQVILLSTDEEIRDQFYDDVKPYVGHSYRINFNEDTASSSIQHGYFGEEN